MTPDPKPPKRVRDPELMRALHVEWRECAVTGETGPRLSLHHVSKHPRSDVRENLVMLEGDGTTGFHGRIEAGDPKALRRLGAYLRRNRPDVREYLIRIHKGNLVAADAWFQRVYGTELV